MLKIVHFTNTFAPMVGGIEKAVARLAADHGEEGHFCRIVTPATRGAEVSGEGVLRVPAIKNLGEKGFSLRIPAPSQLRHWMEAIEPDLLHAHQPFMLGDTAWRTARERCRPLVFTHHTLYERYAHWRFIDEGKAAAIMLSLTTQYANRCDLCIAPTESIRQLMRERGIEKPIEVAPTGIDLEPYEQVEAEAFRERFGIPREARLLGHLGRISRAKNMEFLCEVVCRVLAADPGAWFLLAGEGDALAAALETFRKQGVGKRVVSTGNLGGQEVADAHAAMDLFLFASHTDTQGLVLAEAMAAGTPVVALDAPGARDCLVPDVTGLLLPAGAAPEEMAEGAGRLLGEDARREAMREAAIERAAIFERRRCSRRTLGLYQDLVESHAGHAAPHDSMWEHFLDRLEAELMLLEEKLTATSKAFW